MKHRKRKNKKLIDALVLAFEASDRLKRTAIIAWRNKRNDHAI
jgi:hypothetical protein